MGDMDMTSDLPAEVLRREVARLTSENFELREGWAKLTGEFDELRERLQAVTGGGRWKWGVRIPAGKVISDVGQMDEATDRAVADEAPWLTVVWAFEGPWVDAPPPRSEPYLLPGA